MIRLFHRRPSAPTPPETYAELEALAEDYERLEIAALTGHRITFEAYADLSAAGREILADAARRRFEAQRVALAWAYARLRIEAIGAERSCQLSYEQYASLDPVARALLDKAAIRRLRDWRDNPREVLDHVVVLDWSGTLHPP